MNDLLSRRDVLLGTAALATVSARAAVFPDRIRVAIVGLEGHYSEVLRASREIPGLTVTAIAESDAARAARAARDPQLSGAKLYTDYRRLLDAEKLEVAAVCGPNHTRAAIVRDCAARRIPVIAEKPLALTLDDLAATRKAVVAAGIPITMLLPMRFAPPYQAMRALITRGEIGEVAAMGAQKSYKLGARPDWMKRRATFGGTIPYIGIHMIDLMRFIGGREFVEAAAFQARVGFEEVGEMENSVAAAFRLDNGGTASLRMDYLRPETATTHGDDRLRIAGTRGVVEYQEGDPVRLLSAAAKPQEIRDLPAARPLVVDFLESLYLGKRHAITPEEVYRVTEICLRTREAAESGRVVRL